ncbi:FAD-dependent monooxygenase [Streptomyces bambusae]|uniref:FAD-dependent oxidoreductase n=1 Tax=Streptomyces bambusae TaxID=1550616 RepID=UPI001CFDE554|nr:FAD-dependent monooxygenase [Streptomyces bambusae]MCB5168326.1 FAD-dependent monooxygenase [Streptomyces bambusae]
MNTQSDRGGAVAERAVVIGGSYTGLVTARVLTEFFEEVVLVERDGIDEDTGTHPSAPQGYHAHAMLAKGGEVLERLFPGLREELREAGAPVFDYGLGIDFLLPTGTAPRGRTGVMVQTFTRDELERRIRRRVTALPRVTLRHSTRCTGLLRDAAGRVRGVLCSTEGGGKDAGQDVGQGEGQGNGQGDGPDEIRADLVVDASGRTSKLEEWLAAAGVTVPAKRVVQAKITYTSMNFPRAKGESPDYQIAYQMLSAPDVPRAGVLLAVERERWTCSLFGFQDEPPTDDGGYLEFARSLGNPRLAEQLERRTEQEPTYRYTNIDNRWRQYHAVRNWPEGLIALGDAVCVFNPVYGQGLTVAAMEADLLGRMLARRRATGRRLAGFAADFQKRVARLVLGPWTLSTNSDLMWAPDGQPLAARIAHWYNARLFRVAVRDAAVWARFVRVVNMTASPALLFHPSVALKVLSATRR